MGIKEQLQSDLTEAIRSRNEIVSGTIRMVLTSIRNEEVSGKEERTLADAEIITVLTREGKKRREAAEAFADAGRADKAELEKAEGEVILKYLPAQMSEDDVKKLVAAAIAVTMKTKTKQTVRVVAVAVGVPEMVNFPAAKVPVTPAGSAPAVILAPVAAGVPGVSVYSIVVIAVLTQTVCALVVAAEVNVNTGGTHVLAVQV
jgi:uncharacterized protein YqeY